jgi:hypothetical protein
MALHIHEQLWQASVNDLREFLRISEAGLVSEFKSWGDSYEKRTTGFSDEDKDRFIDAFYDDLALVRDTVPNLFRHAAFVMIVGFFEASVADLCRLLHRTKKVNHEPPQLLYLSESTKYLTTEARLPKSMFGRSWIYCRRAESLRNAIVHNNGTIPAHAKGWLVSAVEAAQLFVKRSPNVSLSDRGHVLIEPGFCESVLTRHETLYRRLLMIVEGTFYSNSQQVRTTPRNSS